MTYDEPAQQENSIGFTGRTQHVDNSFARDVLDGLGKKSKAIPSKYFYDAKGSHLFEEITDLKEYYPTRTEIAILKKYASEIARQTPPNTVLIEYGSGASIKTQILLDAQPELAAYIPVDVSTSALHDAKRRLANAYPDLRVLTRVADFRHPVNLPDDLLQNPRLGFFPGSTIGNFPQQEAQKILHQLATNLGQGNRLILGIDLVKDKNKLERAYNDKSGVTAAFNLNLLSRINRELDGSFDLKKFSHIATYDDATQRINMYLRSATNQNVEILGQNISFSAGEKVHTEYSHKYTLEGAKKLVERSGFKTTAVWTDEDHLFSVHDLVVV